MPKRRRAQEFKRRMRRIVEQVSAEIEREEALTSADPLDDIFWREHEGGAWCCPSCDYNHPLTIQAAAQEEAAEYKETLHG